MMSGLDSNHTEMAAINDFFLEVFENNNNKKNIKHNLN